jgi:hypothetical protein
VTLLHQHPDSNFETTATAASSWLSGGVDCLHDSTAEHTHTHTARHTPLR